MANVLFGTILAAFHRQNMQKPFEVVVLGTSSATPTRDRNPSAHYVRMDKHFFLIDCGEGTQNQLIKYNLKLQKIKYVLITHLHGDHYFGLPGLITSMGLFNRTEPLIIVGPAELMPLLTKMIDLGGAKIPFSISFLASDNRENDIIIKTPDFEIHTVNLKHRIPCTGYVIKEVGPTRRVDVDACAEQGVPVTFFESLKYGFDFMTNTGRVVPNDMLTRSGYKNRSYAYISDTIYDESIIPFIQGVELLYHEATFLHDRLPRAIETFHSTALQAGSMASMAKVEQLMIGHFSARYNDLTPLVEEAQTMHQNTVLALEGECYTIES